MKLYKEILAKILEQEEGYIIYPKIKTCMTKIARLKCYKALEKIKAIIEDDSLEDREQLLKIEEIIGTFGNLSNSCETHYNTD